MGPTFLCHIIEPQPEVVLMTDHLIHCQLLLPGGQLCQVATLGPAVLPLGVIKPSNCVCAAHLLRLVPGEAVRGGAVAGARHLEPAVRAAARPRHQQQGDRGNLHDQVVSSDSLK